MALSQHSNPHTEGRPPRTNDFLLHGSIVSADVHHANEDYQALLCERRTHETICAWRGDRLVSKIALVSGGRALRRVSAVQRLSGLDSESAPIPVHLYFLRETLAYAGNAGGYDAANTVPAGNRVRVPDILEPSGTVAMQARSVQNLWVEIAVPAGTPPGVYHVAVLVTAEPQSAPLRFTWEIEVLDALLPPPDAFPFTIELWQYPYSVAEYYGVEPFSQAHFDILRPLLQYYRQIGGHTVTATIVEEAWGGQTYSAYPVHYPSMVKWRRKADGSFGFSYAAFDAWVSLNRSLGLGEKIVCYSMIPWGNRVTYHDETTHSDVSEELLPGTAAYETVWRSFLQDFVAHLEQKGWFDQVYIGIDERPNMALAFDLLQSVPSTAGKTLKIAAAMDVFSPEVLTVTDRVADVSVGSTAAKQDLAGFRAFAARRANEDPPAKTTMYTCVGHFPNSLARSMPGESYWTILFAASQGAAGFLRWAYDAWVADPLRDATHCAFEPGDCFLIYPDERDAKTPRPKPSVRLAKLAQGVRDANKLCLLRECCPALSKQIDALLQSVRTDYPCKTTDLGRGPAHLANSETRAALPEDLQKIRDGIAALTRRAIALQGVVKP